MSERPVRGMAVTSHGCRIADKSPSPQPSPALAAREKMRSLPSSLLKRGVCLPEFDLRGVQHHGDQRGVAAVWSENFHGAFSPKAFKLRALA